MIQTGGSGQLSMEGKSHVGRNNLESFWKLSWAARMGRIRYMGWGNKGVRALFAPDSGGSLPGRAARRRPVRRSVYVEGLRAGC